MEMVAVGLTISATSAIEDSIGRDERQPRIRSRSPAKMGPGGIE